MRTGRAASTACSRTSLATPTPRGQPSSSRSTLQAAPMQKPPTKPFAKLLGGLHPAGTLSGGEATHIGDASTGAAGPGRRASTGNVGARATGAGLHASTGNVGTSTLGPGRRASTRNGRASTLRTGLRASTRNRRTSTLRTGLRASTRNRRTSTLRTGNRLGTRNRRTSTLRTGLRASTRNGGADGAVGVDAARRGIGRGERRHRDGGDRGTGEQNRLQGDLQSVRFECHAVWTTHTRRNLKL
jgi:hypothetical protein